jgi:hypothetical protein
MMSEIDPYRPYLTTDERQRIAACGVDPREIMALKVQLQAIVRDKAKGRLHGR